MRNASLCLLLALAALAGCDQPQEMTITRSRVASAPSKPFRPGASARDRFPSAFAPPPRAEERPVPPLAYSLPAGWHTEPAQPPRLLTFHAGGHDVECTVVYLPGDGGGMLANVNRWRRQMGLPPSTEAEVAALPRRQVLGGEAIYVDLSGAYSGMGGDAKADQRMVGVMVACTLPGQGAGVLYVKLVGPTDLVAPQLTGFEELCASLAIGGHDHAGHDHGADEPGEAGPPAPGARLVWEAPPGWEQGPERPMREVTYRSAERPEVECYVSVLGGTGGGLVPNINRWRGQLGQPDLSPAQVDALPRVPVLGRPSPLVEVAGTYSGMEGGRRDGFALLALVCELEQETVFVKMIGPAADVAAERERFLDFCRSLRLP